MKPIKMSSMLFLFFIFLAYLGAMAYSANGKFDEWKACFLEEAIHGKCGE